MILEYLSTVWAAVAPGLGDHLWQSTLCLAIAGLLTLVMRKNRAQARYGLWLAASVKFLIPFSLLVFIGTRLARPVAAPPVESGFYVAVGEVSQPFTKTAVRSQASGESRRPEESTGLRYRLARGLPAIFVGVWLCGFLAVLGVWRRRWRGMSRALREATPLREGREVEALRRAERLGGIPKPIGLLSSPASLEPGIFGIVRPVLVWPQGISERLEDAQLEAILAHEVWHVRRRDNLVAAIHMLVEAIFWFHPLVWWLGARLVEERERACDEEVVRMGNQPQVYAESVLKTCEFCVESPLACVSGVTGADLKKRIIRVMTQRGADKLGFAKKLTLVAAGAITVAGPVSFGLLNAPQGVAQSAHASAAPLPSFEVASIKPNRSGDDHTWIWGGHGRFRVTGAKIKFLIEQAYDVKEYQISGGPSWINSERFDIEAKAEDAQNEEEEKLPPERRREQERLRIQRLLADRFKLRLSHTPKEMPVYALVVAKNGPKLRDAKPGDTYPNGMKGFDGIAHPDVIRIVPGEITGQGIPIARLVNVLSEVMGRTVLDQTGLKGTYDFTVKWTLDQSPTAMPTGLDASNTGADTSPPSEIFGPSFFTATQEQLGLKLVSQKGPVEVLVIDHVEKPSEN